MATTRVTCSSCGTDVYVAPPTLGQFKEPGGEVPIAGVFDDVPPGELVAEAEQKGIFRCPSCKTVNSAPQLKLTESD